MITDPRECVNKLILRAPILAFHSGPKEGIPMDMVSDLVHTEIAVVLLSTLKAPLLKCGQVKAVDEAKAHAHVIGYCLGERLSSNEARNCCFDHK